MRPLIPFMAVILLSLLHRPTRCFGLLGVPSIEKFRFLPLGGRKQWGVHLEGPPTQSYNEWNPDSPSCRPIYDSYLNQLKARDWDHIGDRIYNVSKCILDSSSTFQQQTIQAAAVLLGFSPIMLSTVAPTLSEVALVSLYRPWLAVILSLGTAAVYPTRMLHTYDDRPCMVLRRLNSSDKLLDSWLRKQPLSRRRSRLLYVVVGLLQYLFALVAAFNVLHASIELGIASISVLSCSSSFHPLLWALCPLLMHTIVCGMHHWDHTSRRKKQQKQQPQQPQQPQQTRSSPPTRSGGPHLDSCAPKTGTPTLARPNGPSPTMTVSVSSEGEQSGVPRDEREEYDQWPRRSSTLLHLLPSSCHPKMPVWIVEQSSLGVDLAHRVSTILAFIQTIFGVVVFSSLLFVAVVDAIAILLRFLASVIACRIIIMLDLGGMRWEEEKETEEEGNIGNDAEEQRHEKAKGTERVKENEAREENIELGQGSKWTDQTDDKQKREFEEGGKRRSRDEALLGTS